MPRCDREDEAAPGCLRLGEARCRVVAHLDEVSRIPAPIEGRGVYQKHLSSETQQTNLELGFIPQPNLQSWLGDRRHGISVGKKQMLD